MVTPGISEKLYMWTMIKIIYAHMCNKKHYIKLTKLTFLREIPVKLQVHVLFGSGGE